MNVKESFVSAEISCPFYTLNELNASTEYIWIVCHGYGQLAKHFIRRFDMLQADRNFVIAPQGLSRFYLDGEYGHVGASWMTKENREEELQNQRNYFDALFSKVFDEIDLSERKLCLFGFSQGVSMICRFAVSKRIQFDKMILWAGEIPREQTNADWEYSTSGDVHLVIGNQDRFFNEQVMEAQKTKVVDLFAREPFTTIFDGKHKVSRDVLTTILQK